MPTHTHIDNGKERIIHSEDCFDCNGYNSYIYIQNDLYGWEFCSQCSLETDPVPLLEKPWFRFPVLYARKDS